jgi:hypothetical protein
LINALIRLTAALLLAHVLSGCASLVRMPDQGTAPDLQRGYVYGRSQYFYNGIPAPRDQRGGFLAAHIMSHVSPFTDTSHLNRHPGRAGKYAFSANASDDGYFVVELPPGKYYVVEFGYVGFPSGFQGMRTYYKEIQQPSVITFEVLAGRATYIGDTQHLFDGTKSRPAGANFRIKNDEAAATAWFLEKYPKWKDVTTTKLSKITKIDD